MSEKLVIATNNQHKVEEIRKAIGGHFYLMSLTEIGCTEDIAELGSTLEANALIKARYVYQKYHINCFADDTGLEVEALNNEPGVYSARYAGAHRSSEDNMDLVLERLKDKANRIARFRTVIALILDGKEFLFEGVVSGTIREQRSGTAGFGYDPIFQPEGYPVTFAEMSIDEKNTISHRGRAVQQLLQFLMS